MLLERMVDKKVVGQMTSEVRHGFTMLGLLITMACIIGLFVILASSINKRVTGEGNTREGTINSFQDQMNLNTIHKGMTMAALSNNGDYLIPSKVARSRDWSLNTTANLYAMLMHQRWIAAENLISPNDYGNVELYNGMAEYSNPQRGDSSVPWSTAFKADLSRVSNTSYAHMPLIGDRFDQRWNNNRAQRFPLFGTRGPLDGRPNPDSYTYGADGTWAGWVVMADGSIQHISSFSPPSVGYSGMNGPGSDNIYAMEEGIYGGDAILTFTKSISEDDLEIQHD